MTKERTRLKIILKSKNVITNLEIPCYIFRRKSRHYYVLHDTKCKVIPSCFTLDGLLFRLNQDEHPFSCVAYLCYTIFNRKKKKL